jgi:hypothetical protein
MSSNLCVATAKMAKALTKRHMDVQGDWFGFLEDGSQAPDMFTRWGGVSPKTGRRIGDVARGGSPVALNEFIEIGFATDVIC